MKVDAIVVGARCAGAATAMLLARGGARVLLVDRGAYGTDTLSTHALMRGAVLQLDRWGVLPAIVAAGTPPVRSTTFGYTTQDVTVPIESRFGVDAGARCVLHADLVIGADGLRSTIARRVGAPCIVEGRYSAGTLYSYWDGVQSDGYSWIYRDGASIGT